MKMRLAALATAWLLCGAAEAGTYTIDFSALAADSGQVVTTTFDAGPFLVNVNAVRVIGPGDPAYSGSIGIIATVDQDDVVIDSRVPVGGTFLLDSISGTFAPDSGLLYRWNAVSDLDRLGPAWTWLGTAPGSSTFAPPVPTLIDRVWLTQVSSTAAQMTAVVIDGQVGPAAIAEPSGAILLAIGGVAIAGIARRTIAARNAAA